MERVCPCAVFCWEITTPCKGYPRLGERDKEGARSGERGRGGAGRGEDEAVGARLSMGTTSKAISCEYHSRKRLSPLYS